MPRMYGNALQRAGVEYVEILQLRLFFALGARRTILAQDDKRQGVR
jgi:hypothetical protein